MVRELRRVPVLRGAGGDGGVCAHKPVSRVNYEHRYPHTRWSNDITRMIRWARRGAEAVALVESWLLTLNFLPLDWGLMYKLPPSLAACAVAQGANTSFSSPRRHLLQTS